ncbi:MAG TPA: hypothetical protein DDW90_00615 [Cyanobacteria bacterium UBA9971]|nr:hypothetical protein [Cyanobacteria bacterium UBA9971]
MFNTVDMGKIALNNSNIYPDNNNNQKKQSNVSFSSRGGVVPNDIKKTLKHTKKLDKNLGALKSYLERFLKKEESEILNNLGAKQIFIHPHFI